MDKSPGMSSRRMLHHVFEHVSHWKNPVANFNISQLYVISILYPFRTDSHQVRLGFSHGSAIEFLQLRSPSARPLEIWLSWNAASVAWSTPRPVAWDWWRSNTRSTWEPRHRSDLLSHELPCYALYEFDRICNLNLYYWNIWNERRFYDILVEP